MNKLLIAALIVVGVTGLGVGYRFGLPLYRQHKEQRLVAQAQRFLERSDYANASLSLRQALRTKPQSLEATRLMAELADRFRSPSALRWRQRLAELAPTVENRLGFVVSALRYESPPFALAAKALGEIPEPDRQGVAYHVVAAELAIKRHRLGEAEEHLAQAIRLEPTNQLHQLNLAVLRLASTNRAVAAEARAALEPMRASPTLGDQVLRSLVADGLHRQQLAEARQLSETLLAHPRARFSDRVGHLGILREANDEPRFGEFLRATQQAAATNALHVAELTSWMLSVGRWAEGLTWIKTLPTSVRAERPVMIAAADCLAANQDWAGLEALLQDQSWDDQEFLRLALVSRALLQQDHRVAARTHWQQAVRQVSGRLELLKVMLELAERWAMPVEAEEVLWRIVERYPAERWAMEALDRRYAAGGNTRGLHRLYAAALRRDPKNPALQNNLAMISLLLETELPQAHALALEAYRRDPQNPHFLSTHAFSLQVQGQTAEALALFGSLRPEQLEDPATAAYYGLVLAARGETNRAARYLALAEQAPLLPEEKALLEQAKRGR